QLAAAQVERGRARPEHELDVEGREALLVSQEDALDAPLAGEQVLRERRPVVRQVLLLADQHQAPVVALAPERLDGAQAGQARTDDGDRAEALATRPGRRRDRAPRTSPSASPRPPGGAAGCGRRASRAACAAASRPPRPRRPRRAPARARGSSARPPPAPDGRGSRRRPPRVPRRDRRRGCSPSSLSPASRSSASAAAAAAPGSGSGPATETSTAKAPAGTGSA